MLQIAEARKITRAKITTFTVIGQVEVWDLYQVQIKS